MPLESEMHWNGLNVTTREVSIRLNVNHAVEVKPDSISICLAKWKDINHSIGDERFNKRLN